MISTKIFCFSLLSLFWMPAVNAGPKAARDPILSRFLRRTENENDWAGAYKEILETPGVLEKFFDKKITNLKGNVTLYEEGMGTAVDDAEHPAPDPHPALNNELDTLPKLVYLLRYSNLDVLNNIKKSPGVDHPRLMKIDDDYLQAVSAKYLTIDQTELERDFDFYIYELALLYAINRPILPAISDELPELHERLELHHGMVSKLHEPMATFMRIQNRRSYVKFTHDLEKDIVELKTTGIPGYLKDDVLDVFNGLSTGILCTIAIWGCPNKAGTELISSIIDEYPAIRYYANLDEQPHEDQEKVGHRIMMDFLSVLQGIRRASPGHFPTWFDRYIPIVMKMIDVGGIIKKMDQRVFSC